MSAAEYKDQGNKAFQAQNFEEAIDWYTKAIELDGANHVLYSNRSGSYASLARYQEAFEDAEKCVTLNPQFAKGYQRKGLAQYFLGEYNKAIESYKAGLAIDPNNQLLKDGLRQAEDKINNQHQNPFGEALKNPNVLRLLQILQQDPRTAPFASDPTFMQLIGLMISNPQMAQQFMQTDPRIQQALTVILENPEAQKIFFSEFAGKMKQPPQGPQGQKMEEEHEHGENCDHDHKPEHHHQEQPQQHQQHHQEPKQQQHQKQHQAPPKEVPEHEQQKNLGNDFYKAKNFAQAIVHYNNAINLKPDEPLYYNNKAAAYIEQKDYDNAEAAVSEGLKVEEEHKDFQKKAKLLARRAKIYQLRGDWDQAIFTYEKSLVEDMNPNVKDDLRRLQKLKKDQEEKAYLNPELAEQANAAGGEHFKNGKFPDAIKEYSEAIKRNPNEPKYYANRATAYMKLMEFQTAVYDLEKCLNLDSKYVKAYIKKGTCHTVMKEYHKAKTEYEKGLALEPSNVEMQQGLEKVRAQIFAGGSEEEQKQRASRAMQDPEIQSILREPEAYNNSNQIINLLNDMQQNPQNGMKALQKNPDMAKKVEKLIEAGVLKVG